MTTGTQVPVVIYIPYVPVVVCVPMSRCVISNINDDRDTGTQLQRGHRGKQGDINDDRDKKTKKKKKTKN